MTAASPEAGFDDVPCGWLRVADDGRILAMNATLRVMTGTVTAADATLQIEALLTPAARIYYQVSLFPGLRLAGVMDEIYLTLRNGVGGEIPVLVNARRREAERCSDWALVRIEQRGRWEAELLQARRTAEEASRASALKSEELGAAKRELERTLAELKESNWMLRKAAEVLPTCMYCSRVKGDQARWQSAIEYLKTNAIFLSHGCCPDCTSKFMADLGLDPTTRKT